MISIVISEKGGAERHERYEQDEVTIGRVKGNDVLLPKGNVSKRHARLICRDGRYIVTDLKSTNGTYVNHRRITHATLVREGDRIYIGDFVLRIEAEANNGVAASEQPPNFDSPDSSTSGSGAHYRPSSSVGGGMGVSAPPEPLRQDVVSHFPIEHDPDESSPSLDLPGPPRIPSGMRASSTGSQPGISSAEPPLTSESGHAPSGSGPSASSEPHTPAPLRSSQPDLDERIRQQQHQALVAVVRATEEALGLDTLSILVPPEPLTRRVDECVDAQIARMVEAGPLPGNVDRAILRDAARRELCDVGPLGVLLEDDNITQVQVLAREVVVHRRGARVRFSGLGFGSDAGIARALARLCARAGVTPGDTPTLELGLPGGRELFAVKPGMSPDGHLVVIRRLTRWRANLDGLVRAGAISRGMATLLAHCVAARANVLVSGSAGAGADELVDALANAVPKRTRTLYLRPEGEEAQLDVGSETAAGPRAPSITLGAPGKRAAAIAAAARLSPDYLVVPPLVGEDLCALMDQITRGLEGVILCATAGTLRQAVARMSTDLASVRSTIGASVAREWVSAAFDIALEVTRLRDGRPRVVRMVEFRAAGTGGTAMRDIFTFAYHRTAAGGSVEGAFYASGTVPPIVEDIAARGMPLDTSIFRRQPST